MRAAAALRGELAVHVKHAMENGMAKVESILNKNAMAENLEAKTRFQEQNRLLQASQRGHTECVQALLEKVADDTGDQYRVELNQFYVSQDFENLGESKSIERKCLGGGIVRKPAGFGEAGS